MLIKQACNEIITQTGPMGGFPAVFGLLGSDWMMLSVLALLVSLLMLSLAYIFANFLRNQPLLAWTKFEMFQIFATALILSMTYMAVVTTCSLDMGFLDDGSGSYLGKSMYDIIEDYFGTLKSTGALLFGYLMIVVRIIGVVSGITYLSNPIGLGMDDSPMQSLGQLNTIVFYMMSGFSTSYLLIGIQMRIVDYMGYAALYYLLPFGIFFRAFEPTRNFGGTLIGLSMTFFLFYPVILVFNDRLLRGPLQEQGVVLSAAETGMQTTIGSGNPDTSESPSQAFGTPTAATDLVGGISSGLIFALKPLMLYFIAAVILPALSFIVLVETARSLTRLLGEEIDVSNLTRMI